MTNMDAANRNTELETDPTAEPVSAEPREALDLRAYFTSRLTFDPKTNSLKLSNGVKPSDDPALRALEQILLGQQNEIAGLREDIEKRAAEVAYEANGSPFFQIYPESALSEADLTDLDGKIVNGERAIVSRFSSSLSKYTQLPNGNKPENNIQVATIHVALAHVGKDGSNSIRSLNRPFFINPKTGKPHPGTMGGTAKEDADAAKRDDVVLAKFSKGIKV